MSVPAYKENTPAANAAVLLANMDKLSERDKPFAASLCDWLKNKGSVSSRQAFYMDKLVRKIQAGNAPQSANSQPPTMSSTAAAVQSTYIAPKENIGDVVGIVNLFRGTQGKLKKPKIRFYDETSLSRFMITPARSRYGSIAEGTLWVSNAATKQYLGSINNNGDFSPGKTLLFSRNAGLKATVVANLKELATTPMAKIRAYGHKFNHCCFCGKELSDAESVRLGYGPICAKSWNLDHNYAGHKIEMVAKFEPGSRTDVLVKELGA